LREFAYDLKHNVLRVWGVWKKNLYIEANDDGFRWGCAENVYKKRLFNLNMKNSFIHLHEKSIHTHTHTARLHTHPTEYGFIHFTHPFNSVKKDSNRGLWSRPSIWDDFFSWWFSIITVALSLKKEEWNRESKRRIENPKKWRKWIFNGTKGKAVKSSQYFNENLILHQNTPPLYLSLFGVEQPLINLPL
jgi:hypothetical protein